MTGLDFRGEAVGDVYVPHDLSRPMTGRNRFELGSHGYDWKRRLRSRMCGGGELIRQLEQQDGGLEILWQPVLNRWVLYRVIKRGGCDGLDVLSAVLVLQDRLGRPKEPGLWIVRLLRKSDRKHDGATNDKEATAICAKQASDAHTQLEAESSRRTREMAGHAAKNIVDYAFREKKHITLRSAK